MTKRTSRWLRYSSLTPCYQMGRVELKTESTRHRWFVILGGSCHTDVFSTQFVFNWVFRAGHMLQYPTETRKQLLDEGNVVVAVFLDLKKKIIPNKIKAYSFSDETMVSIVSQVKRAMGWIQFYPVDCPDLPNGNSTRFSFRAAYFLVYTVFL